MHPDPLRVQPRYRFLTFDLRAAPGAEQPGGLPVALRVVDAHLTHWRYVPLLTVGPSDWATHSIDLRDLRRRQWEEFIGDGNATHRHDKPDFSVLVHVVLEFDCKVPGRPRCGSGAIDVANVRLAEEPAAK